ncbi:TPA: hypothetical protein HA251_04880 [Candidatus Woesearchaeota archaeon]|nr:hypothetical protein [Candidatus Woesearchaeota archaeon]
MVKRKSRIQQALLALFLATPIVSAADLNLGIGTGGIGEAVGQVFAIISAFFSFNLSPDVLNGVMKFLFFLLIFAIFFWAGRGTIWKQDDSAGVNKRTAGIVAFAAALISILVMPSALLTDYASMFPAIIALILTVGPALGAIYWVFVVMGKDGAKVSRGQHGFGLLVLVIAWGWTTFMHSNLIKASSAPGVFYPLVSIGTSWVLLVVVVLIIVQFFRMLFGGFSIGGANGAASGFQDSWPWSRKNSQERAMKRMEQDAKYQDATKKFEEQRAAYLKMPEAVQEIVFEKNPSNPAQVRVKWKPITGALRYEMDFQVTPAPGAPPGAWTNVARNLAGNLSEFSSGLIPLKSELRIRMRAMDGRGYPGEWGYSGIGTPDKGTIVPVSFAAEITEIEDALAGVTTDVGIAKGAARTLGVMNAAGTVLAPLAVAIPVANPNAQVLKSNVISATAKLRTARDKMLAVMKSSGARPYSSIPPAERRRLSRARVILARERRNIAKLLQAYTHATYRTI